MKITSLTKKPKKKEAVKEKKKVSKKTEKDKKLFKPQRYKDEEGKYAWKLKE